MYIGEKQQMSQRTEKAYFVGTAKVGERGQVVIPKTAREEFSIQPGDTLMVIGSPKKGITFVKAEKLEEITEVLGFLQRDEAL